MIKDQDKPAYRIKFVIVSAGLALVGGTAGDAAPQREQENADIGQPHKDTPGRKAKPAQEPFHTWLNAQESEEGSKYKKVIDSSYLINTLLSLAVKSLFPFPALGCSPSFLFSLFFLDQSFQLQILTS